MEVPPLITAFQVSKACKVSKKVASGWLKRAGILERHGERFVVQERHLREKLDDVYQRVWKYFDSLAEGG